MAAHMIAIERRQHPREGVMGQLDDIAYTVLRRYGIGEVNSEPENSSVQRRSLHQLVASKRDADGVDHVV